MLESLPADDLIEVEEDDANKEFVDTVDEKSLTIEEDGQIGFNLD